MPLALRCLVPVGWIAWTPLADLFAFRRSPDLEERPQGHVLHRVPHPHRVDRRSRMEQAHPLSAGHRGLRARPLVSNSRFSIRRLGRGGCLNAASSGSHQLDHRALPPVARLVAKLEELDEVCFSKAQCVRGEPNGGKLPHTNRGEERSPVIRRGTRPLLASS